MDANFRERLVGSELNKTIKKLQKFKKKRKGIYFKETKTQQNQQPQDHNITDGQDDCCEGEELFKAVSILVVQKL